MRYRSLGKSDLEISVMGLGCAPMSRDNAPTDDTESIATVHAAIDMGVTLLDTSDVYGDTHNETLLGKALAGGWRQKIVLATKWGSIFLPDGTRGRDGSAACAKRSIDASLKRLKTDVIDIYYLHRVDPNVPIEESVGAMGDLVKAGKVKHIGVSAVTPDELRRAQKTHPLLALQSEYSLFEREVEKEILPICRQHGIEFVAYSPLWRGVLGGTYYRNQVVRPGDTSGNRDMWADRDARLMAPLHALAEQRKATAPQIALAWLIAKGIVPIPGTRRRKYLAENFGAADIILTAEEITVLDKTYPIGTGEKAREVA